MRFNEGEGQSDILIGLIKTTVVAHHINISKRNERSTSRINFLGSKTCSRMFVLQMLLNVNL